MTQHFGTKNLFLNNHLSGTLHWLNYQLPDAKFLVLKTNDT